MATDKLKAAKSDGDVGLSSDYLENDHETGMRACVRVCVRCMSLSLQVSK